ncbi:SpoIIE family protein phosphatase [Nocardioides sp. ChNu-153]|uniref:PP2C family protein-serine/threonine phosphatase n=1 Tax=Nocardioides sp. ChNu-153 TaxID=2779364 RepID=UPI0026562AD9|nr:GAF domain-containing SpoIIE family protein phosphatase [Nocardioides sp. ChNu-153]MDN7121806.1 SpoIIE family protein phosphatase [Nocardioides sp. ChNu-153]
MQDERQGTPSTHPGSTASGHDGGDGQDEPGRHDEPGDVALQRAVDGVSDVVGSGSEQLDRITRVARKLFRVTATSITLFDRDRAWLPSAQGTDLRTLPRAQTFCDTTQALGDLLVVHDARDDERFADLDIVRDGGIVFYAGHPLTDHLGNVVGTLCLFDDAPRDLDEEGRADLADLAAWAQHELVSSTEMGQAREVQASLLPAEPVSHGPWRAAGTCLPALAVGGDFFDHGVGSGVLHLGVGDVMGKGTSAALLGAGARAAIRSTHAAVTAGADLGVTATQVARSLTPDLERAGAFLTVFEAAVDLDDGYTRWVDAGSGLAAVVHPDGSWTTLTGQDRPFGVFPDDHWSEHTTTVGPGDRLVVISDGVLDLLDAPETPWPELAAIVRAEETPDDLLDAVRRLARERTPLDDVTVLAVFRQAEEG